MSHALKRVAPKRLSFVGAVTMFGDNWASGIPVFDVGTEERTHDRRDLLLMKEMEKGRMPRVDVYAFDVDAYPRMEVGEHGFGYSAVREGYDGAPDSHCPIGTGYTEFEAIANLLESESCR